MDHGYFLIELQPNDIVVLEKSGLVQVMDKLLRSEHKQEVLQSTFETQYGDPLFLQIYNDKEFGASFWIYELWYRKLSRVWPDRIGSLLNWEENYAYDCTEKVEVIQRAARKVLERKKMARNISIIRALRDRLPVDVLVQFLLR
jgi:hypothetical protein